MTGRRPAPGRQPTGNAGNPARSADGNAGSVAVSPAAVAQLAAIRDEWLRPLVDELRAAERTIGQQAERIEHIEAELDRLRNAAAAQPAAPERVEPAAPAHEPWWRRIWWLRDRDDR